MTDKLDLEAYFRRIGYDGPREPDRGTLRALHRLHPMAIPFENLHTLMGQRVALDPASLQRKLIQDRRGGYCFEHNTLFAEVLESLGFEVETLSARVVFNHEGEPAGPRTHMVLLVRLGERTYVCDVGFGGLTLTGPLLLEADIEQTTPHERFRLVHADSIFRLQAMLGDAWRTLYLFDLQTQLPIDFEVANHYVSTHPDSFFLTTLLVARPVTDCRYGLFNNELTVRPAAGATDRRTLQSVGELRDALTDVFGINLPDDPELRTALARVIDRAQG
ncbi:arylamine N-acetyltransferase family protein [Candidatus Rariloculus sp.]|uniref:arylamine N-acetyltransferase family protein n=1 Tax=Candidatus Rariloculus sp. TaxID=3101265 RepID=UPI003D0E9AFD